MSHQNPEKSKQRVTGAFGSLVALSSRLRDHIERADNGVVTAPDDIAVVLRILISAGKGNRFLSRAIRALGVSTPIIGVSPPARLRTSITRLGVGKIPIPSPLAERIGGTIIPVTRLASSNFASTSTASWTWGEFISGYSNKWGGTHVDHDIPPMLEALELHSPASWALPAYALRMAGVAVWEATQQVLRASIPEATPAGVISTAGGVSSMPGSGPDAHLLHLEYTSDVFETSWGLTGAHRHELGHWMVGPLGTSMVFQPRDGGRTASPAEPQRLRTPTLTMDAFVDQDTGDLYMPVKNGPGVLVKLHVFNRTRGHEGERIPGTVNIRGVTTGA